MEEALRYQDKLFVVERFPLFAGLSRKDKALIARSAILVEHKKGDVIYAEGSAPDNLYCVITGRLRALTSAGGRHEVIEYLIRGRYFGVTALLTGEAHSAAVEAINDSIILKIPKKDFDAFIKRIPEIAIRVGSALSRRLRSREKGIRKIFESTIISVFGVHEIEESSEYTVTFASSLAAQTGKKVILVELADNESALKLDTPLFKEELISGRIKRGAEDGADGLSVFHKRDGSTHIIALLSHLAGDYHYVVLKLPDYLDEAVFEALKQSDAAHLIVRSESDNLKKAGAIIADLEKSSKEISDRIKVIVSESYARERLSFDEKTKLLGHRIFATLPDSGKEPKAYSRAVRRISREVGDCLIGLALGCGAAMGFAHIGILRVLERENIPIDIVVGTSMGAFIGAMWASGRNSSEIEKIISELDSRMKALRLIDLTMPKKGLIKGREIKRFFIKQFGNMTFQELKMPFKAICCDIETREEVDVDYGSVADAVMASISIPGVFEPVDIRGRMLVDGGIINPLATNVLMRLGVAKIIAVNTLPSPDDIQRSRKKVTNIFDIMVNSIQAGEYLLAEMSCQNVDVAMHPVLPTIDWYEFYESRKVIQRGEDEAMKFLPQLKDLLAA
jgi:NTE family protein